MRRKNGKLELKLNEGLHERAAAVPVVTLKLGPVTAHGAVLYLSKHADGYGWAWGELSMAQLRELGAWVTEMAPQETRMLPVDAACALCGCRFDETDGCQSVQGADGLWRHEDWCVGAEHLVGELRATLRKRILDGTYKAMEAQSE